MAGDKILITGVNGFVGGPLLNAFITRGHTIRGAVRKNNGLKDVIFEMVEIGNIDGNSDWTKALQDIDVVVHLAARVHVMRDTESNPLAEFNRTNFYGTENLARQAAKAGVKRFVYVSSIKVNGEQTDPGKSFAESDAVHPQDAYAVSKWQAEQALHIISQQTGMEIVIVRPPLIYGPNVKANFAKLLSTINKGIPLPFASIRNSRSLIYVDNLVDVLVVCATHSVATGQTYLVSDGEDVSTPQLIRSMAHALHKSGRIFPIPIALMRSMAKLLGKSAAVDRLTQSLVIDSSRIRKELSWQPPHTMAQGLQATAEWYLKSIESQEAR